MRTLFEVIPMASPWFFKTIDRYRMRVIAAEMYSKALRRSLK